GSAGLASVSGLLSDFKRSWRHGPAKGGLCLSEAMRGRSKQEKNRSPDVLKDGRGCHLQLRYRFRPARDGQVASSAGVLEELYPLARPVLCGAIFNDASRSSRALACAGEEPAV